MSTQTKSDLVRWSELSPAAFQARRAARPLAWIPVGVCEPNGQGVPLGWSLLKANALCDRAARRHGGIVAPSIGWHLHACGPAARGLEEAVGEQEAHLTEVGAEAFAINVLHSVVACVNAGFRSVVVVSGHHGAHCEDLSGFVGRLGALLWIGATYVTDARLATPVFRPDHAGVYDLSQLLALAPKLARTDELGKGPRFGEGPEVAKASAAQGRRILAHLIHRLGDVADHLPVALRRADQRITPKERQALWDQCSRSLRAWTCLRPRTGQTSVTLGSRWQDGEYYPLPEVGGSDAELLRRVK
jgi:creatinine amidohydrolase